MDDHQYLIQRFTRLSKAATIAAVCSNEEEVRATFATLALRWASLAKLLKLEPMRQKPIIKSASLTVPEDRDSMEAMGALGIIPLSEHYYRYRAFRYTTVEDAIAQIERDLPLRSLAKTPLTGPAMIESAWGKPAAIDSWGSS